MPVSERVVQAYRVRYQLGAPPKDELAGAIDVHAHARGGEEDSPLTAAQHASRSGMKAILFKSLPPGAPAPVVRSLQEEIDRWAEREQVRPVRCCGGIIVGTPPAPLDLAAIKSAVRDGIVGLWLPPVTSAWSISRLGGRGRWFDPGRSHREAVPPLPWDEARRTGMYLLDDRERLLPDVRDLIRLLADHGVAMSFGHCSPQEMDALAEEVEAIGFRRAFIDHPMSEVFELDVEQMKRLARAGIHFALTYDELSPLLGVDPQRMVAAVRAVGAEHFMLASDVGLPILPPLVEAYRLLVATLRAYGLSDDELRLVKSDVAARVLALPE
jgi:hypothetical protein